MSLNTEHVNMSIEDIFHELTELRQRVADIEQSNKVKSDEIERMRTENTLSRNALVDTLVTRCFSDLKIALLTLSWM